MASITAKPSTICTFRDLNCFSFTETLSFYHWSQLAHHAINKKSHNHLQAKGIEQWEKKGNKHENEIKTGNKIRGASQDEFSVPDTGMWLGAATDENSYNEKLYLHTVLL